MSKKEKYDNMANRIVDLVGGKTNIVFFTHCATRLRFNLKDKGLVKTEEIGKIEGVLGVQWSGEQLQIIIGQDVRDAYILICNKTGLKEEDSINENLDDTNKGTKSRFSLMKIIDGITGCLTPLIPLMVGAGLVKAIALVLTQLNVLGADSPTYITLNFIGDAGFYFLPIFIGATGAKKFGANIGIGMLLGAILIHPTFTEMVKSGTAVSIYGINIHMELYKNSMFPMIMTMFVCGYVERFFARYSPKIVRAILEPLLTILVMAPLMLCIIAPIGSFFGKYFALVFMWLYNTLGFIGVGLLAALYPLLVMTGMHNALAPFLLNSFSSVGYDPIICTASFISNLNQCAVAAAVAFKTKDKDLKSTASSCAATAFVGITEPTLFGITLKYRTALYASMIGSMVGGMFAGLMKVFAYAFPGNGGVFGLASFIGPTSRNFILMIISIIIGMIVTFIASLILYKDETK